MHPLIAYSRVGDAKKVKRLIDRGESTNVYSDMGKSPLHECIRCGHLEVVKVLIANGANVNIRTKYGGYSPLHFASEQKSLEIAKLLIYEGKADLNQAADNGHTCLHYATRKTHLSYLHLLLENGVDVNIPNLKGNTPLHDLCSKSTGLEVIRVLLAANADVNMLNEKGETPLDIAQKSDQNSIYEALIPHHNQEIVDTMHEIRNSCKIGDIQKINDFLEIADGNMNDDAKASQPNSLTMRSRMCRDNCLLHYATNFNHLSIVKLLISIGYNVNTANFSRITPLHIAVKRKNYQIIKLLLETGANVNLVQDFGYTPLYLASTIWASTTTYHANPRALIDWNNNLLILKTLIEAGSIIDRRSKDRQTPLYGLIWSCDEPSGGEPVYHQMVSALVNAGADVNHSCKYGWTPLLNAVYRNQVEVLQYLIDNGANTTCCNDLGMTPLHIACDSGNFTIVKVLIKTGVEIDIAAKYGNTPLHEACANGNLHIIKLLLSLGANSDAINKNNETVLHFAVKSCNEELIRLLIQRGVDHLRVSKDGKTSIDIANQIQKKATEAHVFDTIQSIKQYILSNGFWFRRRLLILARPHADHETNKKNRLTHLGEIITALPSMCNTGPNHNDCDSLLFQLKIKVAKYL